MNTFITVFSRVKNTEKQLFEWEKRIYSGALVSGEIKGAVTGEESMQKRQLVIRVFGSVPEVNIWDMIAIGEAEGDTPPADASMVSLVRINDRGSDYVRHTKIIAEG